MPAFDPSQQMFSSQSPGFSPQNNPSVPGLGNAFGVPPDVLAKLRMLLQAQQSGSPQQASVLREQLLSVPGVREKLMAIQSPQNPNVQPVAPRTDPAAAPMPPMMGGDSRMPQPMAANAMLGSQPVPMGVPSAEVPAPLGPPAVSPVQPPGGQAEDPRFQGRLKHGKGLPPGQQRKQNQGRFNPGPADWLARDKAMGESIYGTGASDAEKAAKMKAYFDRGVDRFTPMQSTTANETNQAGPRPSGGAGADGFVNYRQRRMSGQGRNSI